MAELAYARQMRQYKESKRKSQMVMEQLRKTDEVRQQQAQELQQRSQQRATVSGAAAAASAYAPIPSASTEQGQQRTRRRRENSSNTPPPSGDAAAPEKDANGDSLSSASWMSASSLGFLESAMKVLSKRWHHIAERERKFPIHPMSMSLLPQRAAPCSLLFLA